MISLTDTAIDGLWPDVTVLLRVDPETGLGRAEGSDRFESEGLELQRAVAEAYEEIAKIASDRVVVVDGDGSVEEVHERVMEAVRSQDESRAMTAAVTRGEHRAPAAGAGGADARRWRRGPVARVPLPRPARGRQGRGRARLRGRDPRRPEPPTPTTPAAAP